ncbi:Nramp family divalent metal transporter [Microbacterium halophytorum]|uniref:Nramp family divalent metal transporter n=1 Tax=Microbacterium halophytorum TaxID=2067568 RepID=UPI000CFC562A|nr:Nramp family divalent metal transporter [Microbacterium halophytorum]
MSDRRNAATGGQARLVALLGPALVAGVAYLDPGNVAVNMSAGAQFGYLLVWVVVLANAMAWLIQYLSAKLGVVTGLSLAQTLGRRIRNPWARRAYWLQAELVAMATDIAEIIGGAVALWLLFDLPLLAGGLVTGAVSMVLLALKSRGGARPFEGVIIGLLAIISVGFTVGLFIGPPDPAATAAGLVPRFEGTQSVLLAASILGATVMPHAIYAHSALARDRFSGMLAGSRGGLAPAPPLGSDAGHGPGRDDLRLATAPAPTAGAPGAPGHRAAPRAAHARPTAPAPPRVARDAARGTGIRRILRATRVDVTIALVIAGTVNLAILLLGAANLPGVPGTDSLEGAYAALRDGLGPAIATLFAVALLASGLASTSVGAYAGAEIMQGLLRIQMPLLARRLITLAPAIAILAAGFDPTQALVLSQVALSFGIPFALVPLIVLTAQRRTLGTHANRWWTTALGWASSAFLIALNVVLLVLTFSGA